MGELVKEKGVWAVSLLGFLAIAFSVCTVKISPPLSEGSFVKLYQEALQSDFLVFLIPAAAALPAGAVYVKELKSRFLKLYLVRIDRLTYIKRKTVQVYAGGFFPFLFAGSISFLLFFFFLYPLEKKGGIDVRDVRDAFLKLLRVCLTGGIFAELSGVFAALFQNYYMAYGLPFVCYYLLIILKERYLPEFYALYPPEWIAAECDWGAGGKGLFLFLFASSVAAVLLHGIALHIRLKEIV